jgi:type I restriction enzyme S subunit
MLAIIITISFGLLVNMITTLRPYAETKPSGMPWLGDLPAHWDVRRNGRLFASRRETGFPDLPVLEVSLRSGVRVRDFDNGTRKQEMGDRSKYQRAVRGDIAYNMMRMWQGAVGIAPVDGLVSPAYVVARPFAETDAAYYAYVFRTAAYMREVDTFSRGIVPDRNRLYWESFKQMPSVYPPLDEQRLIVRFLDWHGAQTAKLIRAKKKIIALLNEQKQAIIHRAVTRGLDPNVRLKPSGIDWIEDIPEHWDVRRLSGVSSFQSGKAHEPFFVPEGEHIAVTARFVSTNGNTRKYSSKNFCHATLGDVLMVMSDLPNGRALARSYLVNDSSSYAVNQRVCRIRPVLIDSQFLAWQVDRNWGLLRHDDRRNQTHLSNNDFKTLPLLCPPRLEQEEIVRSIAERAHSINKLVHPMDLEIGLIQEFRTRLIADVVTGKLDVRAAAASLPETFELEPIDDLAAEDDLIEPVDDPEEEAA